MFSRQVPRYQLLLLVSNPLPNAQFSIILIVYPDFFGASYDLSILTRYTVNYQETLSHSSYNYINKLSSKVNSVKLILMKLETTPITLTLPS